MFLVGKRPGGPTAQLASSSPPGARLIFLRDERSCLNFLVDTGAACSVLPHVSRSKPTGPLLAAANGATIPCWGSCRRRLIFLGQAFDHSFLLAATKYPILGLDFLAANGLLVDASID